MEFQDRIRIVNKSKDGVSLRAPQGQTVKIPWKEFQELYEPACKFYCRLKPEAVERMKTIDDKLNTLVVYYLKSRPAVVEKNGYTKDFLVSMGVIGKLTEEIKELLNCTAAEVLNLVQERITPLRPYMIETPECAKRIRKEENKAREMEKKAAKEESVYKATQSLSDAKGFDKLKNLKFD